MRPLDFVVDKSFKDEKDGRVITFCEATRCRRYRVKPESEELKIRAFLKMYYCAEWSLQLVSMLLTFGWTVDLIYVSDYSAAHFLRSGAVFLGICFFVVVVPYLLLQRTFKRALLAFVSVQDEVVVSGKIVRRLSLGWYLLFWGALILIVSGAVLYLYVK